MHLGFRGRERRCTRDQLRCCLLLLEAAAEPSVFYRCPRTSMLLQLLFQNDAGRASSSASATSGNALPQLLQVTSYAILEVFLLCLVGYVLGKRGVIDAKTKRTLNLVHASPFVSAWSAQLTACVLHSSIRHASLPASCSARWPSPSLPPSLQNYG